MAPPDKSQVLDIIEREAQRHGIPRDDFMRFAYIETGGQFDPTLSRGEHGAKGLFQFVPSTAAAYGISGRELDPVANTDASARLYLDNRKMLVHDHDQGHAYLSGQLEPNGLDMYLTHQEGVGGYRSLQAAMEAGHFSRGDTRANLLNNVNPQDIEKITGAKFDDFKKMSDRDMAITFTHYWEAKYDRIRIPEKNIEPISGDRSPRAPTTMQPHHKQHLLEQGAHSPAVHDLQANLARLGYTDHHSRPLPTDGNFGIDTRHAVERFQHDHDLTVDGVAGPMTMEAILHAQAKHVAHSLTDPKNPDHALYEQARVAVHHLDAGMGRTSDLQSDQLAASLVVAAKREGLTSINEVRLSEDGSHAFAVQGRPDSSLQRNAHVQTADAVNTPIDKSSAAALAVAPKPAEPQPIAPLIPQPQSSMHVH